jgi:RNA ligase
MFYKFPHIEHIDQVLPAIEGSTEFIVADRGSFKVINYLVNMPGTFPPMHTAGGSALMREQAMLHKAIRRECRGLVFDANGRVIARRFHKFFNVSERDETRAELVDLTQEHVILEKLDGSMITSLPLDGEIQWATKMGINDISRGAGRFAEANSGYVEFARFLAGENFTPIFEWCSRQQRIVIDYPVDRLVLTAVRHNFTGEYMSYEDLVKYGSQYNVEVVQALSGSAKSMTELMEQTCVLKDAEGYIIRFHNGHMLKLKAAEYLLMHKTKDNLNLEKNVLAMLVDEKVDDLKAFMLAEDRVRVEEFETAFWAGLNETILEYERFYTERVVARNLDKKRFALEMLPDLKKTDPFINNMVFGQFEGRDVRAMVLDLVRKNLSTQTKVDSVRRLWKNAKWNYHFNGDI